MNRTQIQLTDAQVKALKEVSASENKSMAQLIREAVDALIRSSHRPDSVAVRQRAIEAAGKFHSGVPDLAVHHDDYLSESYADDDLR
jgi:hypothetical protein